MMRIAIIGTGVSGCLAARLLASQHEVTVYEANCYAGGHANTVEVEISGHKHAVDTGFMVFNERTYPNFCRLLNMLKVDSQPSDMSFSVRCSRTGLEYQGSSLNGLFAQRSNCVSPGFWQMLTDITRFNRQGIGAAGDLDALNGQTVGEFLQHCRVGKRFIQQYLVPMAAAIWSAQPTAILDFPASFMIGFFANHGLMQLRDRPQWRTVDGGSRSYVQALMAPLHDQLRLNCPVDSVHRAGSNIVVKTCDGEADVFDQVVFATHADQTLRLLAASTRQEQQILGAFPYQANEAVLHTDTCMLPQRQRAWASWNYHIPPERDHCASVTYDLSRLQKHHSATPILLTLNETESIAPEQVLQRFTYHHPAYSTESLTAQSRFAEISGRRRTHFCGAYWGYGFHEDGVNSALAVARHFGIELEACTAASTRERSRTSGIGR